MRSLHARTLARRCLAEMCTVSGPSAWMLADQTNVPHIQQGCVKSSGGRPYRGSAAGGMSECVSAGGSRRRSHLSAAASLARLIPHLNACSSIAGAREHAGEH